MATASGHVAESEGRILSRLIRPDRDNLSAEAARALLGLRFDPEDLDRIHILVSRNQDDALTAEEKRELEGYLRVGRFLDLVHSKARRSLQRPS